MVFMEESPITKELHRYWQQEIEHKFPEILNGLGSNYLSIIRYIDNTPNKFYAERIYTDYLNLLEDLLNNKQELLKEIFSNKDREFSLALKYLEEINSSNTHDDKYPQKELQTFIYIDRNIHYNYLRLIEGVYAPLIYPLAFAITKSKNKKTDSLGKVNSCVEVLKASNLDYIGDVFNNTIRNGIAHGDISFSDRDIIYRDSKGNVEKINNRKMFEIYDCLIDYCNGMGLALSIFCLKNICKFESLKIKMPRQVLLHELEAQANIPGWEILDLIEFNKTLDGRSQIIIHISNKLLDYSEVLFFCFRTAILAEKYSPGYERYFFSLNNKYSVDGWAGFDGRLLAELRARNDQNFENYKDCLEEGFVFFAPKVRVPKFLRTFMRLCSILKLNMPISWRQYRKEYFPVTSIPRITSIHRNGLFSVIRGTTIINNFGGQCEYEFIRKHYKKIIKTIINAARKELKFYNLVKYLIVGYIRISVYSKDFRKRKLESGGLVPELICTIEIKRLKRIKAPDILGGFQEYRKPFKIVWNSNAKAFNKEKMLD